MNNDKLTVKETEKKPKGDKYCTVEEIGVRYFIGVRESFNTKESKNEDLVAAFWKKCAENGVLDALRPLCMEGGEGYYSIATAFGERHYDYLITVPVASADAKVPEGMELYTVAAGEFARFECRGSHLKAVADKWKFIYNKWYARCLYVPDPHGDELEMRPFGDMQSEGYVSYIMIPVKDAPPPKAFEQRRSLLGPFTCAIAGAMVGTILFPDKDKMLVGAIVGGAVGYFLYVYIKKQWDERKARRKENGDE